jgi:hypothetical protein
LIQNDLAVFAALDEKFDEACEGWRAALNSDPECMSARLNLDMVQADLSLLAPTLNVPPLHASPAPESDGPLATENPDSDVRDPNPSPRGPTRIAVLSFLFNWPSTGGGNMHTAGLVEFLGRAGYDVRHFYSRYPAWGIGRVTQDGLLASEALEFTQCDWNVATIRQRFRAAVDAFAPEYVVISDTWNMKPHLAEAMRGYPCLLHVQALECLCPLNNLRLLGIGPTQVEQCPRNQLATPQVCHQCLAERGHHAGALHQHERALAGVGTADYDRLLRQSFYEAEAVLVLNPITAAMVEPYARRVCIVPWGIDAARFPWPAGGLSIEDTREDRHTITSKRELTHDKNSEPRPGRRRKARGVNPGFMTGSATPAPCSEPRGGDMSGAGNPGDAAPSGLGDGEVAGSSSSPGLAPRALRSRPFRAAGTPSAVPSADLDAKIDDAGSASGTEMESAKPITTLFMAAVAGEFIKGFHIAHEACRLLRETRTDFELVVTFDPPGPIDEFTRSVGWCSQAELPKQSWESDLVSS